MKAAITTVIEEDEIDEYESIVQELEENYRDVLEDVNTAEVTKDFKGSAIQMAEKSKCCLLCKRLFEEGGLDVFIKDLKQSVDESKIQEIKSRAVEIKNDLDSVKSVNLKILNYRECLANVSELESKIKDLRSNSYSIDKELTEATKDMKATKDLLDAALLLKKPLSDATRINLEVQDIDIEIDELNEDLTGFGSNVASVGELQKQQQDTNIKLKDMRQNLNEWTESKYKVQREVQRLENRVKDIKLQISNLERSLADVTNIKDNINETEKVIAKLEDRLKEIKDSLEKLRSDKETKERALKKHRMKFKNQKNESKRKYKIFKTCILHFLHSTNRFLTIKHTLLRN